MESPLLKDLLIMPLIAAAGSVVYITFIALVYSCPSRDRSRNSSKGGISMQDPDGATIFAFRVARSLGVFGLLMLELRPLLLSNNSETSSRYGYLLAFYIYALAISLVSFASNARWRHIASRQLTLLLLVDFSVYFSLDLWPYTLLSPHPFDPPEDVTTWVRVILLALCGIVIPLIMPRHMGPEQVASDEDDQSEKRQTKMSILSRITYSYLDHVVFNASRTSDLTIDDTPPLPEEEKIEKLTQRVFEEIDPVKARKGKRHFVLSYLRIWRSEYFWCTMWTLLASMTDFLSIFGTRNILLYLEAGRPPYNIQPWVWIILVGFGPFVSACLIAQYMYVGNKIDVEVESSFMYLVFHHALRIRLNARKNNCYAGNRGDCADKNADPDSTMIAFESDEVSAVPAQENGENTLQEQTRHMVGKINNLLTSDLTGMDQAWAVVGLFTSVVQLAIAIAILYKLVGWSSLVGFALLVLLSPAPGYVGKLIARYGREQMTMTDKRVQAVTDSLNMLRMIKLFAWEPYILHRLSEHREDELYKIKTNKILDATMDNLNQLLPAIAKITTFAVYALVIKGEISASRIFTTLMVFSIVEMQTFKVMGNIPHVLRAKIHFDRYDDFLNNTELLESIPLSHIGGSSAETDPRRNELGFKHCSFSWDAFPTEATTSSHRGTAKCNCRRFELRFDDEVIFKKGRLNIVVGPTASGKTSVLMALLGEMYCKPHGTDSWYNLPREGGVAYAPQESWVLNQTLRDNVLFGSPYDEERYKKVLQCCALDKDIGLWEARDLTEIGEKGLTLSGGQKAAARVTLARALYSSASILLLDDVLAALDVHTAKWVASKALCGDLVKERTVILVTHNIALVAGAAQYVIDLGRHGTVNLQGSMSEALKQDRHLLEQTEKERSETESHIEPKLNEMMEDERDRKATGKLILAEEKPPGRVEFAVWSLYLKAIGSPSTWLVIMASVFANRISNVGQTWILNVWSSRYERHNAIEVPVGRYIVFYGLTILCSLLTDTLAKIVWSINSLAALRTIHSRLLGSVFSATFRWLDITPIGRIITRCTQDIGTIDGSFSFFVGYWIRMSVALATFLGSAILVAGWYALVPAAIVACLGTFIGYVYVNCQLAIRRERSNAKAPIVGQVSAALSGLACIRAYDAQEYFCDALRKQLDIAARINFAFFGMNRWLAVRIDSLSGLFAAAITTYVVYGGKVDAGLAGFTISVVMSFNKDIMWWVRVYNMLEIQATSLERVLDFTHIEHEPEPTETSKPPAYWPTSGTLCVKNLSAKYSEDSPEVLRNISFNIAAGERVGIVGRTGAGKSSIALALLRAIPTSGSVFYDDLQTNQINLDALRSNITLIPQQPELIAGTLRSNLDPFEIHSDVELYDALRVAGLFELREQSEGSENGLESLAMHGGTSIAGRQADHQRNKIGLDTIVESGGTNFSLGQRQIIALARAIIRKTKLLILDEATAAIDYKTDAAIQRTLRSEFSNDTTLITIAHRLQTIMDYDRIIVLDTGQLVEFDTPKNLLQRKSFLRALVDESEDRESLLKLAGLSI